MEATLPNNLEGSRRTTTGINHLYSSTKNKQKYNIMIESFAVKQYIVLFNFVMAPTLGKTVSEMKS